MTSVCKVNEEGTICWYNSNGENHRDNDKPAVIYADGALAWCQDGLIHRSNEQPAFMADDCHEWWEYGVFIEDSFL